MSAINQSELEMRLIIHVPEDDPAAEGAIDGRVGPVVTVIQPNCSICLTQPEPDRVATVCNHVFHRSCLNTWLRSNNSCPSCRRPDPLGQNPIRPARLRGRPIDHAPAFSCMCGCAIFLIVMAIIVSLRAK